MDSYVSSIYPRLNGLYPAVGALAENIITEARNQGMEVDCFSGLRTFKEQADLYAQGRTKPGKVVTKSLPGQSMHNWGVAFDLVFDADNWKPGMQWSWDDKWPWKKLGKLGESMGLEWGGNWTALRDYPHFQMTYGLHLDAFYDVYRKAKALADSQGAPIDFQGVLNTVWEMLG